MISTLKDNFLATFPHLWTLLVGGALAFSDVVTWHSKKEFKIPLWLRLAISVCAVVLAQFLAYQDQTKNLLAVIDEKRQLSITNNALQAELSQKKDENARLTSEKARLKGQIPSARSLKVRALQAANEYEHFWKTRPKEPVCTQTSTMTPEEQRKVIEPCARYFNQRMVDYQQSLAPKIMSIVQEFKAKGANVMNIENCASDGFCGIPLSVQLRAFSERLDARDNLKR